MILYNRRFSDFVTQEKDIIMNKRRIFSTIRQEIPNDFSLKILEIGCDKGNFVKALAKEYPSTKGIDINEYAISKGNCSKMYVMDAVNTNFKSSSFDIVYSSHVIEHISDGEGLFREISRILSDEGKVIMVYPFEPIRGLMSLRIAWQTYHNPLMCRKLHVRLYTPSKIIRLIRKLDLKHVNSRLFFANTPQWITILRKRRD